MELGTSSLFDLRPDADQHILMSKSLCSEKTEHREADSHYRQLQCSMYMCELLTALPQHNLGRLGLPSQPIAISPLGMFHEGSSLCMHAHCTLYWLQ